MNDGKGAFLYIRKDNRCDQVAADDKKHIYADKTAAENFKSRVKKNDGQHGKSPQSIYLWSVSHHYLLSGKSGAT